MDTHPRRNGYPPVAPLDDVAKMRRQPPLAHWSTTSLALFALVSCVFAGRNAAAQTGASAAIRPLQEDAELLDVAVIDVDNAWAVGNWGTIWHTVDGGRHWRLEHDDATCRLTSVHFVDGDHGWIAGSSRHALTHTTRGILLRTADGGKTWQQDQSALLPGIERLRFFDSSHGWAVGNSSGLFATSLFVTDSGGRSWTPLVASSATDWTAADFLDPQTGALAGDHGAAAFIRQRAIEEHRQSSVGLRRLHAMKLESDIGWVVGDGGLVMISADRGRNWQLPPADPQLVAGPDFDWRAVEARGNKCWVVGSPGSRVLMTADGGRTWQTVATGQSATLRAIQFVDDDHGFAVGALGTILSTSDGGRTWKHCRSTARRAAVLVLVSGPEDAPLELIARLAGNEGYLTTVCYLNRRDLEGASPEASTLLARGAEAAVAAGASSAEAAWAFPIRQTGIAQNSEQLVEGWDRASDGHGLERLESYLVRAIRSWRPEIVVTHAARPRGDDPLGHTINQLVLRASESAADPTRFAEHLTQAGLEPWRVRKVFGSLPRGQLGSVNLTSSQLAPRLGCSLAEVAESARSLVAGAYEPSPPTVGFQLLLDNVPQGAGVHDFLSGITLAPGGDARRLLGEGPTGPSDLMRRVAQKHRSLQAIIGHLDKDGQNPARAIAQIGSLTKDLDARSAGDVLFHLGRHYHATGHWQLAGESFQLLATRYPGHALSEAANVWLLQSLASSEVGWQMRRKQQPSGANLSTIQLAAFEAIENDGPKDAAADDPLATGTRAARALALARLVESRHPAAFAQPQVQFPLAVAQRQAGLPRQGERFYLSFARTRPHDAWWACASGEAWLADPKGLPPKSVCHAALAATKPRLDGQANEGTWQHAAPIELSSAQRDDSAWPAVVTLAHDREFLYVAVNCRKAPGVDYSKTDGTRQRDADLSGHDRIELFLDLDRDWTTAYRLVIDHRGWAAEDCWGSQAWNPRLFIAAADSDSSWSIEAAIPLAELVERPPESKDVWAVGIQRTVPGAGFQSWSRPAATRPLAEGFGYLIFD